MSSVNSALARQSDVSLNVPFVRQDRNLCGAACIQMLMIYWKREAQASGPPLSNHRVVNEPIPAVKEIRAQVYDKKTKGIWGREIAGYLESKGYSVFIISPEWSDLESHISKGRPLLVSLQPDKKNRLLHYVIITGIDSNKGVVIVNDPARGKNRRIERNDFEAAWATTSNWTLLAVPAVQ